MNQRGRIVLALFVGVAVAFVGIAYATLRTPTWQSEASVVLNPNATPGTDVASLMHAFINSGVGGTRVEMISSGDTLNDAGSPPVTITARAVPDTRVITITAAGAEGAVQPGLQSVLDAALRADAGLDDQWRLSVLNSPSAASESAPGGMMIGLAAILVGLVAAVATFVGLQRLLPDPVQPARAPAPAPIPLGSPPEAGDLRGSERQAGRGG